MSLFSRNSESSLRARFGYNQNQQLGQEDTSSMSVTKSSSTPDIFSKSVSRDNLSLQSRPNRDSHKSDDSAATESAETRDFELNENPDFWKEHSVQVIIRVRPLSNHEISQQGRTRCIVQDSSQTITWTGHPESRFTFDVVADEKVSQEMLFKVAGVPMVENCMEGYNSCMFAYGQTGSGKTHTMLGDIEGGGRRHSVNCGMTPRVFEYLFSRIQKDKDARREEKLKFTCRCSFLEIYNEQILDLLDPSSANLQIREDAKKGIYVENITEVEVTSARDVLQQLFQIEAWSYMLLAIFGDIDACQTYNATTELLSDTMKRLDVDMRGSLGAANRKVAATNMNHASSRSHSVFTFIIESKWEIQGVTHHRFARLNLVDLAGSERQKSSGAEGERLKEATNINKSLSTLGLVIMNLVSISNGKSLHVPYRDSKLTFLLQDSLGGNAKTIIIANISPSSCCSLETLSTLKFAQRAKFIKNHAVINEDASGNVLALRLENQNLKKEVSRLKSLVDGRAESHDGDALAITFPGSPGSFKWDGQHELSSPLIAEKKMPKKEYESALVGALRMEKEKEAVLQALAAENQATMQLAKQRGDEIQGLKMRLRFREAGIKRLEGVASGKISAETHLLAEREEHLKEIEVLRGQVDRNQEVTRFAMENLRLKEEIRRLKSFCEDGERERMQEQITALHKKLLDALDWKLMHESDLTNIKKESLDKMDDDFLSSNQQFPLAWRTSTNEENEFLRMQAIQNQSEITSLRNKLDFCIEEKEKLERHVIDLEKDLEAMQLSNKAMADEAEENTRMASLMNATNTGQSDQAEIKTMVDAIAAASQREAEAHEIAICLSKENDELRLKLKVLVEDNNKLIDAYKSAVPGSPNMSYDGSVNPQGDKIEGFSTSDRNNVAEEDLELKIDLERLRSQIAEMHEENDKLLGLYENAMHERDELKRVISFSDCNKIIDDKGCRCPEKFVEIDGGQSPSFCVDLSSYKKECEKGETSSSIPFVLNDITCNDLLDETCLYDVQLKADYVQRSIDSGTSYNSNLNEVDGESYPEVVMNHVPRPVEQGKMEMAEFMEIGQDSHTMRVNFIAGNNSKIEESSPDAMPMAMSKDMHTIREKLVDAQEKLLHYAETVCMLGSFEKAVIEIDGLTEKIGSVECSIHAKQQNCEYLKVVSSELQERKDLANKKLSALKLSLTNFSSSLHYFEQREALAISRLNVSSQHLSRNKEELTQLQLSRLKLVDALSRIRQIEAKLENSIETLKFKVEEENRQAENERVLFAIDNVVKPSGDLSKRNLQVSGKATALLKAEEEKSRLQNQIKMQRQQLGESRKEAESKSAELRKVESAIEALDAKVQKEAMCAEELSSKLQRIFQEKKMLLETQDDGKQQFESMILEYHQSLFEAALKDDELKSIQEELLMDKRELEDLQRAKDEARRSKAKLLEPHACFVTNKVEADLQNVRVSVAELNSLLESYSSSSV